MIYDIIYKIDGICLYSSVSCRLARKVKFYGEWLMKMIWSVIYLVLVAILGHYIGELLPRKWFDYESFPYAPFGWEKDGAVYDKIKIKKWKSKVPDLSRIAKYMVPKKVTSGMTSADVDVLLRETCVAEFVHVAVCVVAVGVCFISERTWGVVLWLVFSLGNVPFILIQRYNRPHLNRLREKMLIREERLNHASSDIVM